MKVLEALLLPVGAAAEWGIFLRPLKKHPGLGRENFVKGWLSGLKKPVAEVLGDLPLGVSKPETGTVGGIGSGLSS